MKLFYQILLSLAVTTLLVACGPSGNSFKIKGAFTEGMNASEIYIYNTAAASARMDTVTMRDASFTYRGTCNEPTPYYIVFPNALEHVIFVSPGTEVQYKAAANDLANYVVTGTPENEQLTQIRQDIRGKNYSETLTYIRQFITGNPTSPVSIYLFDRYIVQDEAISTAQIEDMLKLLLKGNPDNLYLMKIEGMLKPQHTTKVGGKVPNFTVMDDKYKTRKLWKEGNKDGNTLLVFWATWMPNYYDFLWETRRIATRYKENKEDLRSVFISMDNERHRWQVEVRPDSGTIEHYCDGKSFAAKWTRSLGIPSIPYYIITDKDHKIVATGTDKKNLNNDLGKAMNKDKKGEKTDSDKATSKNK